MALSKKPTIRLARQRPSAAIKLHPKALLKQNQKANCTCVNWQGNSGPVNYLAGPVAGRVDGGRKKIIVPSNPCMSGSRTPGPTAAARLASAAAVRALGAITVT